MCGRGVPLSNLPSVWLNELTWPEVELYLKTNDICIVPVGSTEQHGPAGPLGLDAYVAISLAEDTAKQAGVLTTPPLWFSDASHHMAFPGTISLRTETLMEVIKDIGRSLARHGFRKIIFINGHKGTNLPALSTAVRALHERELPEVLFAVADPLHLARSAAGKIKETREHHAGELEMSHVYYKFPDLIRMDRLTHEEVDWQQLLGDFGVPDLFGPAGDTVEIVWSSAEQRRFTPTGSFSPSQHVSAEKGRLYHEHMVKRLVELCRWLKEYDGPIGRGKDS
mgnify:CR=1 FL=1